MVFMLKTPTHVFSCKYCEIVKNTYFDKRLGTATSQKLLTGLSGILQLLLSALTVITLEILQITASKYSFYT